MGFYRKKPIVLEAIQFTGDVQNWRKIESFVGRQLEVSLDKYIIIPTLEGNMKGMVGDWIIRGVKGECYPCKSQIFDEIYEEVI